MTFLELVKMLAYEVGGAATAPTSVVGQTGQARDLVRWVNSAWTDIQGMHDNWGFMREDFSFDTVADTGDYTPSGVAGVGAALTNHRHWHTDTLRCYLTATGVADEMWLVEWDYQALRNTYRFGLQVTGRPVVFAVKPKGSSLMFGSIPNAAYTVRGEYQRRPTEMAVDTDEPDLPEHLHKLIVYYAMTHYALNEAAPEVLSAAQMFGASLMAQLEREELPEVTTGALA